MEGGVVALPSLADLNGSESLRLTGTLRLVVAMFILQACQGQWSLWTAVLVGLALLHAGVSFLPNRARPPCLRPLPIAVAVDMMVASLLVALTGRLSSPFIIVLYLPLIEAALALSIRWAIGMTAFTTCTMILLGSWPHILRLPEVSVIIYLLNFTAVGALLVSVLAASRVIVGRHLASAIHSEGNLVQLQEREEEVERLTHFDGLTGLANRPSLQHRLAGLITLCARRQEMGALLLIDLDHFKLVNDEWGSDIGDLLLKAVAQRMQQCTRQEDFLARTGSNEFAVAIPEIRHTEDAGGAARKFLSEIARPFVFKGREINVTASVGISVYPSDGQQPDALLKAAESALRAARERGTNNFQFHSPVTKEVSNDRLSMEKDLRYSMGRDEFVLYYQPQVDMSKGEVIGFEALVRWKHPILGLVPPGRFIPLAEESGLVIPMTDWVLREACRQNKEWHDAGLPPARVAVNLSARQFQQKNVVPTIVKALEETGLDPKWLDIELTESAAMQDANYTVTAIRALQEIGVEVSMDDFGTGFSSLSYLKKLPFDTIKIDQSFIREIGNDPGCAAIVTSIISLTQNLGRKVIAEGVETEQQLLFLRMHGCQQIQGYLISKPMPAEELTELMQVKATTGLRRYSRFVEDESLPEIIARYSYVLPTKAVL